MEPFNSFNTAIDYIENNLDKEIEYKHIAQVACCSEFHFSRMFSSVAGISLSEYIRRRRLSKAAFDIQSGNTKVFDVALKYGYNSPDAFTRAFRKLHGVSPATVKNSIVELKTYPRLSFQITIKGVNEMEYHIGNYEECLEALTAFNPLQASKDFSNAILEQSDRNIRFILAEVDPRDVVIALKGCDKASIKKVMGNLSKQLALKIMEDMEYCGSLPDDLVITTQKKIANIYYTLQKVGSVE